MTIGRSSGCMMMSQKFCESHTLLHVRRYSMYCNTHRLQHSQGRCMLSYQWAGLRSKLQKHWINHLTRRSGRTSIRPTETRVRRGAHCRILTQSHRLVYVLRQCLHSHRHVMRKMWLVHVLRQRHGLHWDRHVLRMHWDRHLMRNETKMVVRYRMLNV